MRITGGEFCGQKIRVPGGQKVRPTGDKVRKALFSILAAKIPGCRFLDLFAGSGAVGLEALSRQADCVWWVESDSTVFPVLKDNVSRLAGETGRVRVIRQDVIRFLQRPLAQAGSFDVVFADPPYDREGTSPLARKALQAAEAGHILARNGIFVMEQAAGEDVPVCDAWCLKAHKTYGETRLLFWGNRE